MFPQASSHDLLYSDGSYTIGFGDAGSWTLGGSREEIKAKFKLLATRAAAELGGTM